MDLLSTFSPEILTTFRVIKKIDETIASDDTLHDDDELFFALEANKNYYFELIWFWVSDPTPDFQLAFSVPTGTTNKKMIGNWKLNNSVQTTAVTGASITTTSGTSERTNGIYGYVTTGSTAGNLTFQWAQETSDVANTIVKAGSILKVYEAT